MAWVQIVNQIDQLTDDGRNGYSHQRAGNRHGFKNPVCRDLTANPYCEKSEAFFTRKFADYGA